MIWRREHRERGASLVEFALIAPLLLLLLFGIIEFGFAWRDKIVVGNAVQTSTRVGAALGNDIDVDLFILESATQGVSNLSGGGADLVSHVDIFEVNSLGNPVPGELNRYFYTFVDGPGPLCDWTPCPQGSSGYVGWSWTPDERDVEVGNLDVIGVRIVYAHNWITGGLVPLPDSNCDNAALPAAPTNCWTEQSIMRLEPLQFGLP